MADFDPTNRGKLQKADKGNNPQRPDYKGEINIEGAEYWLSGWIRTYKSGKNVGKAYLSLVVEPKKKPKPPEEAFAPEPGQASEPQPGSFAQPADEDVPF